MFSRGMFQNKFSTKIIVHVFVRRDKMYCFNIDKIVYTTKTINCNRLLKIEIKPLLYLS